MNTKTAITEAMINRIARTIRKKIQSYNDGDGFEVADGGLLVFVKVVPSKSPHIVSIWNHNGTEQPEIRKIVQLLADDTRHTDIGPH